VQDEQVRLRAGRDRVGMTLIVAEFNERIRVVKLLDDRAYLPARKSVCGKVRQQRYRVQNGRPFVLCFCFHHSAQQVTNLGTLSPDRTIQIILTTALLPCRLMVASRRQWVPQGSTAIGNASLEPCGFKQGVSQPRCVVALKIKRLAEHPSLVSTARVRRVQTIILDLADIEDGLIAMRQMRRHAGARTSRLAAFSEYING
jgi:hypothetical protein